jgi:hypothetical protein
VEWEQARADSGEAECGLRLAALAALDPGQAPVVEDTGLGEVRRALDTWVAAEAEWPDS